MLWVCIYGYNECTATYLLQLVSTDWADYRTEYNTIVAYYSTVRYFVAPSKPCKWSGVLAQAIQLTAFQDMDVTVHALSELGAC